MGLITIKNGQKELKFNTKKLSINEVNQLLDFARNFFLNDDANCVTDDVNHAKGETQ